eukprot:CAMPEP_0114539206 /NCGR_PEP_ID=MMETSP0114-20121206/117_1 /TAXON_ID=31324 /ORGANISM="Goniomonas sp, Strain m" /LENGTH=169 /DNA_ID=CAMNT_0001723299 /DNA_START=119 /DNA_END=628 /DNA_ORIENTATION=-
MTQLEVAVHGQAECDSKLSQTTSLLDVCRKSMTTIQESANQDRSETHRIADLLADLRNKCSLMQDQHDGIVSRLAAAEKRAEAAEEKLKLVMNDDELIFKRFEVAQMELKHCKEHWGKRVQDHLHEESRVAACKNRLSAQGDEIVELTQQLLQCHRDLNASSVSQAPAG